MFKIRLSLSWWCLTAGWRCDGGLTEDRNIPHIQTLCSAESEAAADLRPDEWIRSGSALCSLVFRSDPAAYLWADLQLVSVPLSLSVCGQSAWWCHRVSSGGFFFFSCRHLSEFLTFFFSEPEMCSHCQTLYSFIHLPEWDNEDVCDHIVS